MLSPITAPKDSKCWPIVTSSIQELAASNCDVTMTDCSRVVSMDAFLTQWCWGQNFFYSFHNPCVSTRGIPSIVNETIGNKLQWKSIENAKLFIHENAFESVACEMAAILSRGRWVKLNPKECWKHTSFVIWAMIWYCLTATSFIHWIGILSLFWVVTKSVENFGYFINLPIHCGPVVPYDKFANSLWPSDAIW